MFDSHSIRVHARCSFPSWDFKEHPFRQQDFDWQLLALAVKGDAARMKQRRATLPIGPGGRNVTLNRNSIAEIGTWFGRWAAQKAKSVGIISPVFVAIPNRDALVSSATFRTATLAQEAARAFGANATAFTGLRFKVLVSKEDKKRQGIVELRENMILISEPPPGDLVFIDDIFTQGHHLTAACLVLPSGREPRHALICGRTMKDPQADMGAEISEVHYTF